MNAAIEARIKERISRPTWLIEELRKEIRDLKRAEEARKMESIAGVPAGLAHDLNNWLSIIIGNAESAMMELDPDGLAYQNLEDVIKAAELSTELVRQLLVVARTHRT